MSTIMNSVLFNRGFSGAKINADQVGNEELKVWRDLEERLHSACYKVGSECYNSTVDGLHFNAELMQQVDLSSIYAVLHEIFDKIGTLENGTRLQLTADRVCNVLIGFAMTTKNQNAPELAYQMSKLSNSKKYLAELEDTNGASEESIENVKLDIQAIETEIDRLKGIAYQQIKVVTKTGNGSFCKKFEDYLADMILHNLAKSEEEIQAEKDARKAARKAKKAQKKNA